MIQMARKDLQIQSTERLSFSVHVQAHRVPREAFPCLLSSIRPCGWLVMPLKEKAIHLRWNAAP